jgi:urease accessory protein
MAAPWRASLELEFERRDAETVMTRRTHTGPLRIQKPLYPEGRQVCHAVVLHPPAGIAGGDELDIAIKVGAGAHALLTTPGAGKWYRSSGQQAAQNVCIKIAAGATAEWLPQESILFSGALANMRTTVELEEGANFIGVEALCLGRRASGERFAHGALSMRTDIDCAGKPLWRERGRLAGDSPLLASPIGLAGFSVSCTVLAAGMDIPSEALAQCRQIEPSETGAQCGVTAMPRLLVGRYLGHSSEAARAWFVDLWRVLRPALTGREAITPRIWAT